MKKFIALITALLMVVAIVPMFAVSTSAAWDGTTATEFSGKGTSADPYIIDSAEKLAYLAKSCNDGDDYLGCYFTQTADIDLGDKEWTPIGNGLPFSGVYDGLNHKVTGFKITDPAQKYVGLFGIMLPDYNIECGIMNLTVEGSVEIDNMTVDAGVGSVVGWVYKDSETGIKPIKLINVTSNVNFKITNCTKQPRFGGVAGYAFEAYFENVIYNGTIDYTGSANSRVGGIVGQTNRTEFKNCVNNGTIVVNMTGAVTAHVGGISGMTTFKIQDVYTTYNNCVNNGSITATSEKGKVFLGGIVGATYSSGTALYIKAVNCLNTAKLYGECTDKTVVDKPAYVGGIGAWAEKTDYSVEGCVNASADIVGTSGAGEYGAGIVGAFGSAALGCETVTIKDCINITDKAVGVECTNSVVCENGASDAKIEPAKTKILDACVADPDSKINGFPGAADETTKESTVEVITTAQPDDTTAAPIETTEAAVETTAAPTPETTAPATKSGCGSAAMGIVAVVAVLGCALVAKKH